MLDDRVYMRRPFLGPPRPATTFLLILNAVAFCVQSLVSHSTRFPINHYFALSVEGLRHGYVWQLLTFQIMHGGLTHLLFNCLAIYIFGREVEAALGRKSFLTLYFFSGVIGGLCQALVGAIFPAQFGGVTVGASAGAYGLTAAFAMLFPEQVLLLFFIIPLRAKYLLALCAVLACLGFVLPPPPTGPRMADAAHLGGMLAGWLFVRFAVHWHWPTFRKPKPQPMRRLVKTHSGKSADWPDAEVLEEDLSSAEFLSKEVDPILDKISAHGIHSLTDRERRILESARQKMGKR
jgi:membrane associated rhomboid family serine protease